MAPIRISAALFVGVVICGQPIGASSANNILMIIVDNLRPALGAFGVTEVVTPHIDRLAASPGSIVLSRAFCQVAWCSPSRTSFLTGRRPQTTQVYNFLDSFRVTASGDPAVGKDWVTCPGYFNRSGFYSTASGKVFHPKLPANADYPASWSDQPAFQQKFDCALLGPPPVTPPDGADAVNMSCEYTPNVTGKRTSSLPSFANADAQCADVVIDRLVAWKRQFASNRPPFFVAAGLQGPRLPWSFPSEAGSVYPDPRSLHLPKHKQSPQSPSENVEWFRPTEIAWYVDVIASGGISHAKALPDQFQRQVRHAYYAAITNVDTQVGRLLSEVVSLGVDQDTAIVFTADHAQNLGESNMWSMMNLLETSLRVPMIIRPAPSDKRFLINGQPPESTVYEHVVELVDLFPTMVSLANLPPPPEAYGLEGDNLVPGLISGRVAKRVDAAFSQITRCKDCKEAYAVVADERAGCDADAADMPNFYVPCSQTNRSKFDLMGVSIRTINWRYSMFCEWDGEALVPNLTACGWHELYDHRNDTTLYNVDNNGEYRNDINVSAYSATRRRLDALLRDQFSSVH